MSRTRSNTQTARLPEALHVRAIRVGLALAIATSLLAFAVRAGAQEPVRGGSSISIHPTAAN